MVKAIILLTDGIPPYVMGGMQKHSRLFAEYVAREGVHIILYHVVSNDILPSESEVLAHFSIEARPNLTIRTFRYPKEDKWPGHYLRAQMAVSAMYLNSVLKETMSYGLVYSKGFVSWSMMKNRNQLPERVPIAVKFHGMNMFQTQPDLRGELAKYMLRGPVKFIMNQADIVFSYGGKITTFIRKELKDESKIVELPSGIDPEWLTQPASSKEIRANVRFLFVGRCDRLKGLPELNKVISSHPELDFSLTLVGPIPEDRRLKDARLNYLGSIQDPVILRGIFDDHDVLICPSISEGMPNVIIEAMSRGLAVIATDVGSTSVLVRKDTGWLIKNASENVLLKAIEAAMKAKDLRKRGENAVRIISTQFNWSDIAKRFVIWYKSISVN